MRRFEISEYLFMFHILSLLPLLFILYFSFFGGGSRCGEAKMLRQLKRSKRKIIRYDLLAAISILEYTRNATREPHTLPPFYSSRNKYELHKKAYLKSPPAKGTSVKESDPVRLPHKKTRRQAVLSRFLLFSCFIGVELRSSEYYTLRRYCGFTSCMDLLQFF